MDHHSQHERDRLIGKNLRVIRMRRRFSQEQMAEQFGIKRSSWSGYETGAIGAPTNLLVSLSEHYRISLDRLMTQDLGSYSEFKWKSLEDGLDHAHLDSITA